MRAMTMQDNKAALLVGICDDEEHIHRTVEDMLSLYAESNQIRLHIVHYDSAKQLLEKKDELDFSSGLYPGRSGMHKSVLQKHEL